MPKKKESSSPTTTTLSTLKKLNGAILHGQRYQYFALPKNIIYYMAMNPASAKVYKKLVRTCKFFYNINPILVVSELSFSIIEFQPREYAWEVQINEDDDAPLYKIDMDKIPFKIWITKFVWIGYDETLAASFVQKKLFRSDADSVFLHNQVLTLDEFSLICSKAKEVEVSYIKVTENDGEDKVMFEKIIEKLPKLQEFEWRSISRNFNCFSSDTVKKLTKIPHFGDITTFRMYGISYEFDAKDFFDYIKTQKKHMNVKLHYIESELSAKHMKQIDEIIDEMSTTDVFTYKPPYIWGRTSRDDQSKKLNTCYARYEKTKTQL